MFGRFQSKYKNKKVERAGYTFDSKGEASLFDELKLMESAGEIKDIQVHDTVYLTPARIMYKPDYAFTRCSTNEREWAEFKGFETSDWRIKLRLWKWCGPGKLTVYRKGHAPEIILPKGEV